MDVLEILQQCSVQGHIVKLPDVKLERKLYEDVAKRLNGIGGKWKGGKTQGFVFDHDPVPLIEKIKEGEVINLRKDFQFFETPKDLATQMVRELDLREEHAVLEPSAGRGALIDAVLGYTTALGLRGVVVFYCEKMIQNNGILKEKYANDGNVLYMAPLNDDFLNIGLCRFDRIIANPPFSNNQDVKHIYKMWEVLAPGGRIVTLASRHWQLANDNVSKEFRTFLQKTEADVQDVAAGTFKESGTNIATVRIIIDKPLIPTS